MSQVKFNCNVTNGSNVVTGIGTTFLADVSVGDIFVRSGFVTAYQVSAVNSNTQVLLSTNYQEATASNVEAAITRDATASGLPLLNVGDRGSVAVFNEAMRLIDPAVNTVVSGIYAPVEVVATAGTQVFTLNYDVGLLQVLYNGVQLAETDYTATNGTSITLSSPVSETGDVITFIRWGNLTDTVLLGSGTAAERDAATSGTPTTGLVDAALGYYGVGVDAVSLPPDNNLDQAIKASFLQVNASTVGRPFDGNFLAGINIPVAVGRAGRLIGRTDPAASSPEAMQVWWQWRNAAGDIGNVELYHTGNNIDARDYGIGRGVGHPLATIDTNPEGFLYGGVFYLALAAPANGLPNGSYQVRVEATGGTNNNLAYTAIRDGAGAQRRFIRHRNNGVWQTDWQELYHTGNLELIDSPTDTTSGRVLTTGAGGVLATTVGIDDGTDRYGRWNVRTTDSLSPFGGGSSGRATVLELPAALAQYTPEIAIRQNVDTAEKVKVAVRTSAVAGTSPWVEIYHTGNANFNEFGGNGTRLKGVANASSSALFQFQTSNYTEAVSISVTGTFAVVTATGALVASGLTPLLSSSSGVGVTYFAVSGISVTSGDTYYLQGESASSKIKVNF